MGSLNDFAPCCAERKIKMVRMAKEILVYACDYEKDGTPIFAVAKNINEISEDSRGERVGVYVLNRTMTFDVKKTLK